MYRGKIKRTLKVVTCLVGLSKLSVQSTKISKLSDVIGKHQKVPVFSRRYLVCSDHIRYISNVYLYDVRCFPIFTIIAEPY